ncbi:hypothetical protein B0H16DRAFT_1494864 [Mycena metata]|uniref:Uncharacterized protein n=1 Tax=Mycena metata TaxID=1033252 RepID=A0AAD7P0R1_9AGAR|nr:hypothetical protein B0H16DRAFT_1494864 [Mycena metata]
MFPLHGLLPIVSIGGMILSSNHHHQGSALQPGPAPYLKSDLDGLVMSHYRHLESLLDSALATLALIQTATSPPVFTPHLLGVLQLLAHHITQTTQTTSGMGHSPSLATTTPLTTSATTSSPDLPPRSPSATYAAVADAKPSTPDHHATVTTPDITPDTTPDTSERPSRVVVRFDLAEKRFKPQRVDELRLYVDISKALGDSDAEGLLLSGVRWTKKGNLILRPAPNTCTAQFLVQHQGKIWATIRSRLQLPEGCEPPLFETDEPWHSVVFHDVPVPDAGSINYTRVDKSLRQATSAPVRVTDYAVLCRPEDLHSKRCVAVRVSLSSAAVASGLIKNGGFMIGAWCRVSPYAGKRPKSPSPGTISAQVSIPPS